MPFVATLPNTVLCPFTLAVDGTPPLTPSCPTPLYIHAVYVSAWRFGARGVRNTVELKLPSLATVGTGIFLRSASPLSLKPTEVLLVAACRQFSSYASESW